MFKNLQNVSITTGTIIKVFVILAIIGLAISVTDILALLLLSYILYASLNSSIERIQKVKIKNFQFNRVIASILVSLVFFLILFVLIWSIIGPVIVESRDLFGNFETLVNAVLDKKFFTDYTIRQFLGENFKLNIDSALVEVSKQAKFLLDNPSRFLDLGKGFFSGLLTVFTLLSLVFYQLSQPGKIRNFIVSLMPNNYKEEMNDLINQAEDKLGFWMQGQLTLMFAVGILCYVGFSLIGIQFALPLAVIFGIMDILPVIGPTIAFFPLIIVAIATGEPWQVLAAVIYTLIVQQIESNLLIPKIMQETVGLDPVVVLIAIMIGSQLLGLLGAILSIPVTVIIIIFYDNWQKQKSQKAKLVDNKATLV
jgi:predicted PurR-regulated permease PerM